MTRPAARGSLLAALAVLVPLALPAADRVTFDFRTAGEATRWQVQHGIRSLTGEPAGLRVEIAGEDPYFAGPVADYPVGTPLWLNLRLKSDTGGGGQVFFHPAGAGPTEEQSVRFPVSAGAWQDIRVPCPALGPGYRLRIDPPGDRGTCMVERVWFEDRVQHPAPEWPSQSWPASGEADAFVRSGGVRLGQRTAAAGGQGFTVEVEGRALAAAGAERIGYVGSDGRARWFPAPWVNVPDPSPGAPGVRAWVGSSTDAEGCVWTVRRRFESAYSPAGTVRVDTELQVSAAREILHWPALSLQVGSGPGGVGGRKQQALLAGVEYLDDEPSSSEADLTGPQARRQVVDTARLTFPLAVVAVEDRYIGLGWRRDAGVAVVFDSPDRTFRSGGHWMGLVVPGSDGLNRDEGSVVPYATRRLEPGQRIQVRAWILGGPGGDVVPAVRHWVGVVGLPDVPDAGQTPVGYFRLAARGWLDSEIRVGDEFRHAVVGGTFRPGPAADAACFLEFLADRVGDEALSGRLRELAPRALARVPREQWRGSAIGHVRMPVVPLVFGAFRENLEAAVRQGRAALGRFEGDGLVRYRPSAGGVDYGRTHWTNEANGLTAEAVASVLSDAAFSGDPGLIEAGLKHLRGMAARFPRGVPRGAQTWEIPLHTPDILASAHLVRAFTLGYELSGDPAFVEAARYWAWTGVPFVYLDRPVAGAVGLYATTPVLGATQWVAPNWIGLPVQWCGLVYADALYRFASLDPGGPWRRLADGITASGVQQTYPATDGRFVGLLPDSFSLRPQQRNPANINPGTLLACATRWYGAGPMQDSRRFPGTGIRVMAAGAIVPVADQAEGCAFRVEAWPRGVHRILIHGAGLPGSYRIRVDGQAAEALPQEGLGDAAGAGLVLEVRGPVHVELRRR